MSVRVIFFDVDDTLCRMGVLHPCSREVLYRLHRESNVDLAIATGRSPKMLPLDIVRLFDEGVFSHLVSCNGQLNFLSGKRLSAFPLSLDKLSELVAVCRRFGFCYQMLGEHLMAWSRETEGFRRMADLFAGCVVNPEFYKENEIFQFSFFYEGRLSFEAVEAFKALGFRVVPWHHWGADVLPLGQSKLRGIDDVCKVLGASLGEAMAFGDGLNDLEMISGVGTGVAMQDGAKELLPLADFVCPALEDRGVEQALRYFKVLV